MTRMSPFADGRGERGHAARHGHSAPGAEAISVRAAVVVAAVVAAGCVAATVVTLAGHASPGATRSTLIAVTAGAPLAFVAMLLAAYIAAGQSRSRVNTARIMADRGQAEVQAMADRVVRGDPPTPPGPPAERDPSGGAFELLVWDLEQFRYRSGQALLRVAGEIFKRSNQQREIFANLAWRMQSLVHREIETLEMLEGKVEDPVLLKGLFTVDHLATQLRRQSESLAVLGGAVSRRQWTRSMTMREALRASVTEVDQYSRVKVVPPVEGTLRGPAVADVIHLIAELVENATKFSRPETQVMLSAQVVSAGVAVEVEDRGLGMKPGDMDEMNSLLADPNRVGIDELLRGGRIGLYVVAVLAGLHGIRVQLRSNFYGGISAIIILPLPLLEMKEEPGQAVNGQEERRRPEPITAGRPLPMSQEMRAPVPSRSAARENGTGGGDFWNAHTPPPDLPRRQAADHGRPPLPTREPQANLAPELRGDLGDDGRFGGPSHERGQAPAHMPGLMADFLGGFAEAEDGAG